MIIKTLSRVFCLELADNEDEVTWIDLCVGLRGSIQTQRTNKAILTSGRSHPEDLAFLMCIFKGASWVLLSSFLHPLYKTSPGHCSLLLFSPWYSVDNYVSSYIYNIY